MLIQQQNAKGGLLGRQLEPVIIDPASDSNLFQTAAERMLSEHKVALCLHDMAGSAPPRRQVGPFVYLRLHGPLRYRGSYSNDALGRWASWLAARAAAGADGYVYFNNDIDGAAPHDARRLQQMLTVR